MKTRSRGDRGDPLHPRGSFRFWRLVTRGSSKIDLQALGDTLVTVRSRIPSDSPLSVFSEGDLQAIFGAASTRAFAAGQAIVSEGEPGDSMFFVLEGHAEARGLTELSFINPGHRRSATIVATTDGTVQVLDQASIRSLIVSHPTAIITLLQRTCAFLVDAERNLIADLRRRNAELEETIAHLDFTRNRLTQEEATARKDALTGLYNRRCFDHELPIFMERAGAIDRGLALIAMDLDHFKPLNDTLGHAAGDHVLRGVGTILRTHARETDLPCRIGGDEFILALADIDEPAAQSRAEVLRAAIEGLPHPGNERGLRITATLGGTLLRAGEGPEEFMHRADEALYDAKRDGRNRVAWRR
jgi:diguanylate cyclase (GGDEF)-like protein